MTTDHALEQSLTRSFKIWAGVIGMTASRNVLQKWMLLYRTKAAINNVLNNFYNLSPEAAHGIEQFSSKERQPNRLAQDENDVQKIIDFINSHGIFNTESAPSSRYGLRNIVGGVVASKDVRHFILSVQEEGKELRQTF